MRDNSIVTMPMIIEKSDAALVKGCAFWGHGWNDKFLITPRKFMESTFGGPFKLANEVARGTDWAVSLIQDVQTPELFMRRCFELFGVDVREDSQYSITAVDGRCQGRDKNLVSKDPSFCLVPEWKDCRPYHFDAASYPTCALSDPPPSVS
eukprot:gnl/TRDRNA2_/TRDRNA2_91299_c1_seq1.p1 gnl/TRDRNA2_/TRDRNA2_91299_c1~~gnl/TRDRNA2_/TRDRNA2_91299_c1_seq1.p1  ORF type:complete len:151 (-),score=17.23 gnl/TRDRNA2_/TRDRNA2_91299_c1_seq1:63-515(-)